MLDDARTRADAAPRTCHECLGQAETTVMSRQSWADNENSIPIFFCAVDCCDAQRVVQRPTIDLVALVSAWRWLAMALATLDGQFCMQSPSFSRAGLASARGRELTADAASGWETRRRPEAARTRSSALSPGRCGSRDAAHAPTLLQRCAPKSHPIWPRVRNMDDAGVPAGHELVA